MIKQIYRHARRYYLWYFRRKYVLKSLEKRKGNCEACGCCRNMFKPCKHYNPLLKKCLKYPDYPLFCKLYPIDERDKNEFSKESCGFYWEENE